MSSLVLLSGGMDSAIALAWAVKHRPVAEAIHFAYGQKPAVVEQQAAVDIAMCYNIKLTIRSIPTFEHRPRCPIHQFVAPGRNLIFLAYAAAYCEVRDIPRIVVGAHLGDFHKNCICQYSALVLSSWMMGRRGDCIEAPFANLTKSQVAALGVEMGVPIDRTYSCYEEKKCGVCPSCVSREEALECRL